MVWSKFKKSHAISLIVAMPLLLIFTTVWMLMTNPVRAEQLGEPRDANPNPFECYGIGDEYLSTNGVPNGPFDPTGLENDFDYLASVDRLTGNASPIGKTGTRGIEAMTFIPNDVGPVFNTLYAVADPNNSGTNRAHTLGTMNLQTGHWSPVADQPIGMGVGPDGLQHEFMDIDGLAYDVQRDILWATERIKESRSPDILLQLDPATGQIITGAFPGPDGVRGTVDDLDWVHIPVASDPVFVTPAGEPYDDIDDITVDPTNGRIFLIANKDGAAGGLVEVDPDTGQIVEYIGIFRRDSNLVVDENEIVDDIEGLVYFNEGQLFGSTGNNGPKADTDRLFVINIDDARVTEIGAFPAGIQDIESLSCFTAPANLKIETATNGDDADIGTGPGILHGAPLDWTYTFTNTGGVRLTNIELFDDQLGNISTSCTTGALPQELNPGESFTCKVNGTAETIGKYTNIGTVSAQYVPKTSAGAPPISIAASDPSHYFGLGTPRISLQKTVYAGLYNGESCGDSKVVRAEEGTPLTYCFEMTNAGETFLNNVIILDAQLNLVWESDLLLRPNETIILTRTSVLNADSASTAVVAGTPTGPDGQPIPDFDVVRASDYARTKVVVALGDLVWLDSNGNGIQESGEHGLASVDVTLFDSSGLVMETASTDEQGNYRFTIDPEGRYSLGFEVPDSGYFISPVKVDDDDQIDSDADPVTGLVDLGAADVRSTTLDIDAGMYAPPLLTISLNDGDVVVEPGQSIHYSIQYSNEGLSPATGVTITEVIPQHTHIDPDNSSPLWNCQLGNDSTNTLCTIEINRVEAKSSGTIDLGLSVIVDESVPDDVTEITNIIFIEDDGAHGVAPEQFRENMGDHVVTEIRHPDDEAGEQAGQSLSPSLYMPLIMPTAIVEALNDTSLLGQGQ